MKLSDIITAIALILVAAVLFFGVFTFSNVKNQELMNSAVDNCSKLAY